MNRRWYALKHDSRYFSSLIEALSNLGFHIDIYAPTRLTLHKIKNRPSPRKYEVLVFSDYLLLRLEMTAEHYQKVVAIDGAYSFVSLGGSNPIPIPQEQIDLLKAVLKKHRDELELRIPTVIGGDEGERAIQIIVNGRTEAARNAGWVALMHQSELQARRSQMAAKSKTPKPHPEACSRRPKPARLVLAF